MSDFADDYDDLDPGIPAGDFVIDPQSGAEVPVDDGSEITQTPTGDTTLGWQCTQELDAATIEPSGLNADPSIVAVVWTAPTGETASLGGFDTNGDGIVDLVFLDANGDGIADTWLLDTTGQPSVQTGAFFADTTFLDTTGSGVPDCVCVDSHGTGSFSDPTQLPSEEAPAGPAATAPATPAPDSEPAAPATPEPTPALGASMGFAELMSQTDDPATQAALQQMSEIQTRMAGIWTR